MDFDGLVSELKDKSQKELIMNKENRDNVKLLGHVLLKRRIDSLKFKISKIKNKLCWWKNADVKEGKNNKKTL